MSTTLSYGYKLPTTGDRGPVVFPDLEDNIQQLNDHNHNGTNSSLISSASITAVTQTLLAGSWVLVADGIYKQTVTIPGTLQYDNTHISFTHATTGHLLYLSVEKVSATQFDVFINDNTAGLKVRYT
jgi:hypothetical protein